MTEPICIRINRCLVRNNAKRLRLRRRRRISHPLLLSLPFPLPPTINADPVYQTRGLHLGTPPTLPRDISPATPVAVVRCTAQLRVRVVSEVPGSGRMLHSLFNRLHDLHQWRTIYHMPVGHDRLERGHPTGILQTFREHGHHRGINKPTLPRGQHSPQQIIRRVWEYRIFTNVIILCELVPELPTPPCPLQISLPL